MFDEGNDTANVQDTSAEVSEGSTETSMETEMNDAFLAGFSEDAEGQETSDQGTAGTEEAGADEQGETPAPAAEPEKYTIKVNGREEAYTLEELATLAQKGADYDRLKADNELIRKNTERISELARSRNTTVDEIITQAEEGYKAAQFEELYQKYINDGIEEDVAEMLANKDLELEMVRADVPQPTEEEISRQRDIQLFNRLYPDVKAEDIPDTVFEDISKGMTLVEAYQKQLIADEKAKAAVDAQNKKNAEKSMGSARTAQDQVNDAFLSEFMKE